MAKVENFKRFVADSNQALELKLVRTPDDLEDESLVFKPSMTHQVFGEEENVFGYKNLRIKLYYSAGSLQTYVGIKHSGKITDIASNVSCDDILLKLVPHLSQHFYTNIDQFRTVISKDESFVPHGSLLQSFVHSCGEKERKFEIYHCGVNNKEFLSFHSRLQTFLLWYVDGSSFIDVDDAQWKFFVLYEKYISDTGNAAYAVGGYATVYEYYAYPSNIRPRISQMLVLPPFQRLGLGAKLLQAIYNHYAPMSKVVDITVEDPSEDFQRLRDYVDCLRCSKLASFSKSNLLAGSRKEMELEAKSACKIPPKQARRVYEILRLKEINEHDEEQYKAYRIAVKQRLNGPNKKHENDVKKLHLVMTPSELSVISTGPEERIKFLTTEYIALEKVYKLVIKRLNSAENSEA